MNASIPVPPSTHAPQQPAYRTLRKLLARRLIAPWSPARWLPAHGTAVALSPFSFWAGHASLLTDEGGDQPSDLAGYAFHTDYMTARGGPVRFRVNLHGLTGKLGRLRVMLIILDPYGNAISGEAVELSADYLHAGSGRFTIAKMGRAHHGYALFGALSDGADLRAASVEIDMLGSQEEASLLSDVDDAHRDFMTHVEAEQLDRIIVDRPPTLADPISQMCTAEQMGSDVFAELCQRLGLEPSRHRKQWEFAFVLRALEYYGALQPGFRGLGFGVGVEPLPSLFASLGCSVVATDLSAEDDRAQVWNGSSQLGTNLRQIFWPALCDEQSFFDRVSFRSVDMNAIPADLTGFDFTWSSCAFEHLGSIDAGLAFYENALECLKPGGIAVHTTELNLSSNGDTLDNSSTVLFRRRDFETLARRLLAKGHDVIPITFDSGSGALDRVIDMPPYSNDPHLKLSLMRWVTTSFGMVVRRRR